MIKTLFIVSLVLAVSCSPVMALEETKHEVTLTITYNAVTLEEAVDLIEGARRDHRDACKLVVGIEKARVPDDGVTLYLHDIEYGDAVTFGGNVAE